LGLLVIDWKLVWPTILVFFGLWLIWRAFNPRKSGIFRGESDFDWGEYHPNLSGQEIRNVRFSHSFGDFRLDFTQAILADGENHVCASHGFGTMEMLIPRDISIRVHADAGFGQVTVMGEHASGIGPHLDFRSSDYDAAMRKLRIEADIAFGEVRIWQAE
jgi:predicted membrane protein